MVELADIFRLHGPEYRQQFGARMLPSHLRAMQDIEQCRTAALGGQLYFCNQCQQPRYSYHSCIMGSNLLWGVRRVNSARSMGRTRVLLTIKIWPT